MRMYLKKNFFNENLINEQLHLLENEDEIQNELIKKYSLKGLMTDSRVMCISEKVLNVLKQSGWKKLEIFEAGEELTKLKK